MTRDIMLGTVVGLLLGAGLVHALAEGALASAPPAPSRHEARTVSHPSDVHAADADPLRPLRPGSTRYGQRRASS